MPFDRIKKALEKTSDEAVQDAANNESFHPDTREAAREILAKRAEQQEEK